MSTAFAFLVISLLCSIVLNVFLLTKSSKLDKSKINVKLPKIGLPSVFNKFKNSSGTLNVMDKEDWTFDAGDFLEQQEGVILVSDKSTDTKELKCFKVDAYYLVLRKDKITLFQKEDNPKLVKEFNSGNLEYDMDSTFLATEDNILAFIENLE